ncbi:hypothetical protein JAAARDRAFT_28493 [Jaapia argillacea MUCL 33604]|uniref:Ubiquitin-like-conjugating enzyme ATG10 n=1 Tax=Jaapia argillacea MUCL 33604 TaxID=933084 RepID=A0A067QMS7_9AGAM|nr:hypothetical protein JAAARDRAFT_28493 [Jaapia argillacea MUCL 33604]
MIRYTAGWSWQEHRSFPGLGFLTRQTSLHRKSEASPADPDDDLEDLTVEINEDPAIMNASTNKSLACTQYVVYSPTFQVPAFYFTVHDEHGSPLPLADLVQTSLFRSGALPLDELTSFGLSSPTSTFPLLSQGDHPTLGTPAWFFHPCETSRAVGEVMGEIEQERWTETERLAQWLKSWFMVLSNVVDLSY